MTDPSLVGTRRCRAADVLAGLIVRGGTDRPGIGLRVDCPWPRGGVLSMVHWFHSPYDDTPPGGIVEDVHSLRLNAVEAGELPLTPKPHPPLQPLPADRGARRNLLSADGTQLVGLRGWDIPHDRHMVITEFATGRADIAAVALPSSWCANWSLTLDAGAGSAGIVLLFRDGSCIWKEV